MSDIQWTEIEERALQALHCEAFPLNLAEIRNTVELLLTEVGRYGFFNEYTDHSFGMSLECLIMPNGLYQKKLKEC